MNHYEEGYKFIVSGDECEVVFVDTSEAEAEYECYPSTLVVEARKILKEKGVSVDEGAYPEELLDLLRTQFCDEMFWACESGLEWYRKQELEECVRKLKATTHSVIILDYSYGGEGNIEVLGVYHSLDEAKDAFVDFARDAREVAENRDWYIAEEFSTCFVAYKTGYYPSDHTRIFIQEVEKK